MAEHAAAAGLTGLEFLSGIPGSIGGAVAMNAGAYGGDMSRCWTGSRSSRAPASSVGLRAAQLVFAYRHAACRPVPWWCSVRLRAMPGAAAADRRAHAGDQGEPRGIAAGAGAHRRVNLPRIREGMKAWELIDAAGCRGLRQGRREVSELHCNFLINTGNATAADLEGLGEGSSPRGCWPRSA